MVYNHLIMVSPKLVEKFAASLKFHQSSLKLSDVMAANVKKPLNAINETKKNAATAKQKKYNKVVGGKPIWFTIKEDKNILEIFPKKGVEAINYKSLITGHH